MLQSRYAADGDAGLARGDLNPQDSAITGDKEAFNMLSGSGGDGGMLLSRPDSGAHIAGRASSGNAVGASAASAYDVRPVRQDDLGIDRLGTGAVVSSRKGEMRRSRLRRGLGVTGLDGIGGSTGSMAMPAVADLEDLHLS